ncbi:zinc finger protein RFP-like [Lissotriton helveticus]
MAAANPLQSLEDEATCAICLDFYEDPVTMECGHNFCRACITECLKGAGLRGFCPQCKQTGFQGNLRPNRQLMNMVELVRQLTEPPERPKEQNLCEDHQEPLKVFCKEDLKPICVVCSLSAAHRSHTLMPSQEAAEEYKGELQDWLQPLKQEMAGVLHNKLKEEEEYRALKNKLEEERRTILTMFQGFHQLLKEQEDALLRRLEDMQQTICRNENTKIKKLSGQMSLLKNLITELEMKCKQPAEELLKVRV